MIHARVKDSFASWRGEARRLLAARVPPGDVIWMSGPQAQLWEGGTSGFSGISKPTAVPAEFIKIAEAAACFHDEAKWPLLYRLLFRLVCESANLLEIESDPDVRQARLMEKAVNRDVHKFHAFVRFRETVIDGEEIFVAWHEPQHFTVERAAPFFARRFGSMKFSILTPKGCAHWDQKKLSFSPPATKDMAPARDETEDFWLLYYRSIFNPFRLKVNAMKKELPVRHWRTLPEAALIPELIERARGKTNP